MEGNRIVLVWLLAVAIVGFFLVNAATEQTQGAPSNVTVQTTIAISLSTNFTDGLFNSTFDTGTDNNADPGMGAGAGNNLTNDMTSNTAIKVCVRDNAALTNRDDGVTTIPNANYTWQNSSSSGGLAAGSSLAFTTSFVEGNTSLPRGGVLYFGFWLDIPPGQAAGEYNNTVFIKAVKFNQAC